MNIKDRLATVLVGLTLTFFASTGAAEPSADEGRKLAAVCMGCHGVPGVANVYPTYTVPKLAGQNRQYLVDALFAYRSGLRRHPTMQANAANLSNAQIESIALFFSQLKDK